MSKFKTISTKEVAKLLGVCPITVSRYLRSGKMVGIKRGKRGQWMITAESVKQFLGLAADDPLPNQAFPLTPIEESGHDTHSASAAACEASPRSSSVQAEAADN